MLFKMSSIEIGNCSTFDGSTFIAHSHQNVSCFRSGVDYSRFVGNGTAEE